MRYITVGSVQIELPNDTVFAFDPCIVSASPNSGTISNMTIAVNYGSQLIAQSSYQPINNEVTADLRSFVQGAFNRFELSEVDYGWDYDAPTGKMLTIDISINMVGSSTPITTDATLFVVWGSLNGGNINESYKLYRFGGLPFCVTGLDDGSMLNYVESDVINTTYSNIVVEELPTPKKYMYLRWINTRGSYIHYAFCMGDTTLKVSNGAETILGDDYKDTSSYRDGNRYNTKTAAPSVKCYALDLNDEDFELLRGVALSPIVDWYNNGVWEAVNISAKSFTKSKLLTDIEITVEKQDIIIQSI